MVTSVDIDRYLATGAADIHAVQVPAGQSRLDAWTQADRQLRDALVARILDQTPSSALPEIPSDSALSAMCREKVAPMVEGLFAAAERSIVLETLARSAVLLHPGNIECVLHRSPWLHTAWTLANMYLAGIGTSPLSDAEPVPLGLSEETTCYLSLAYLRCEHPFADYLVHEAAHVFHNCTRESLGLPEKRHADKLLMIDFRMREPFAYACEVFSRIAAQSSNVTERRHALADYASQPIFDETVVDRGQHLAMLEYAIEGRNGWKRILDPCKPKPAAGLSNEQGSRPSSGSRGHADGATT